MIIKGCFRSGSINAFFQRCRQKHVCIVGSGPSAFYAAQYLLKYHNELQIDMLEKLPAPFGLVRYGVAPDHPEVKNVISTFTQVAKNSRFNYWGNITVGKDIYLRELQQSYDAILLAYGAGIDRRMDIKGEDLRGVVAAKDLVAWYNGYPNHKLASPDLDCETVAIVGMGNVSLDVARILLSPVDKLKVTDIPEAVITTLSKSRVRRVVIIGRRGPLHVAFTLKELREITQLPAYRDRPPNPNDSLNCFFTPPGVIESTIGAGHKLGKVLEGLPRARRRLTEFIIKTAASEKPHDNDSKSSKCEFRFLRSPQRVLAHYSSSLVDASSFRSEIRGLELAVNKLEGPVGDREYAILDPLATPELLECGMVVRSIGYRSLQIDPDIPFDDVRGVIACRDSVGRVGPPPTSIPQLGLLYSSGWAKRGAVGVIVDTSTDARITAEAILVDLAKFGSHASAGGFEDLRKVLESRNVRPMTFSEWERVDSVERSAGALVGKPRSKITSVDEILRIAFAQVVKER